MQRPSDRVLSGLRVLRPYIAVALESPSVTDLQHCTERELGQAEAALAWIDDLLDEKRRPRAMRG